MRATGVEILVAARGQSEAGGDGVERMACGYAKQIGATYADYAALCDANGNMKLDLAKDEVHPTEAGCAVMRPIAESAIR